MKNILSFRKIAVFLMALTAFVATSWGQTTSTDYTMNPFSSDWNKTTRTQNATFDGAASLQIMGASGGTEGEVWSKIQFSNVVGISLYGNANNARDAILFYSEDGTDWTQMASVALSKNSWQTYTYNDLTAISGKTVYLKIRASANSIYLSKITIETSSAPTITAPTVGNLQTSNLTHNAVNVTVDITDGGAAITKGGVEWNTTENFEVGSGVSNKIWNAGELDFTGANVTMPVTGLNSTTTYYLRAFVENSEGTTYSEVTNITTLVDPNVPNIAVDLATADFENILIGETSAGIDVAVTPANLGTEVMTYRQFITGSSPFSINDEIWADNEETLLTVTFTPTTTGEVVDTLYIECANLNISTKVVLKGVGEFPAPTAIAATDVAPKAFTAHWTRIAAATEYELSVAQKVAAEVFSEDFSSITAGNSTGTSGSSSEWNINNNFSAKSGVVYQAGGAVRCGSASNSGGLTTKILDLSGGTIIVSFDVKGWTDVDGDIEVKIDNGVAETLTYTAKIDDPFENKTVTFPAATTTSKVTITATRRAFLDNIVISVEGDGPAIAGSPFAVTDTFMTITGLTPETGYAYTVKAKKDDLISAASNVISVTTAPTIAPVAAVVTPAAGEYLAPQEITLSCATEDAKIEYKLRVSANTWTEYAAPFTISANDTLDVRTTKVGMDTTNTLGLVYKFPTEVANIAAFKATSTATNDTKYKITGDVTFVWRNGRNIYVKDATGGLLIYDNSTALITTEYNDGDVISGGVIGTLAMYGGVAQLIPLANTADGTAGAAVEPIVVTMDDLIANFANYESQLVKLEVVDFASNDAFGASGAGASIGISQGSVEMICRNNFGTFTGWSANLNKQYNIVGFTVPYFDDKQIAPRSTSDIEAIPCEIPTNLNVENITSSEATLSWTGKSDNYEIAYKIAEDSDYATVFADAASKNLESLLSDTTYTFKVRGICSEGDTSNWSVEETFRTLAANAPNIVVTPTSVNFGNVHLGKIVTDTLTVTGTYLTEDMTLAITGGTTIAYETLSDWNAQTGGKIVLTFTPSTEQAESGELTIKGENESIVHNIPWTGTGVVPVLTVDSVQVHFGTLEQGTNAEVIVKLNANYLQSDVTLAIEGTDNAMFTLDKTTVTKPENGTLTNEQVKITYTPTTVAEHTATLKITYEGKVESVDLFGTAIPAPTIIAQWNGYPEGNPENYPAKNGIAENKDIAVLDRESDVTLTTNTTDNGIPTSTDWNGAPATERYWIATFSTVGYGELSLTSKQRGSNTGPKNFKIQYKVGDDAWTDVENGAIAVANDAYVTGVKNNLPLPEAMENQPEVSLRWIVTSNTSINNGTIASGGVNRLDATVKAALALPVITATPTTLDFGEVMEDETSVEQTITVEISNPVGLISYEKGGDDADAFTLNEASMNANIGGTLGVTFTPTEAGAYNATLTFHSQDAADKVVTLTGTGVAAGTLILNVSADTLKFAEQHSGTTSASKQITVSAANLTHLAYSISDATDFEVTGTLANTGGTLDVTFKPQTTGAKSAMIYIESDELKDTVLLQGTGVTQTISTDLTEINTGDVMIERTKATTLRINAQYLTDNVTLALDGTDVAMFSIDKTTLAKPANGTMTDSVVTITYAPTALGAHTAKLTISSTGAVSKEIPLSGNCTETVFFEDFDVTPAPTANLYGGGLVTLESGEWYIKGYTEMDGNDQFNGIRSIRLRGNSGDVDHRVEMNFDKANGVGTVTFKYGSYGTHDKGKLQVQISSDGGSTWQNRGDEIIVPSWVNGGNEFQTANVVVNKTGDVRVRIVQKSTAGRATVNVDDVQLTDCTQEQPALEASGTTEFGYVKTGTAPTNVVTVIAENLTENIVYDIEGEDATSFAIQANSEFDPLTGGNLEVIFNADAAETYTATLVISSGSLEKRLALSGTGIGITPIPTVATGDEVSPLEGETVLLTGIVTGITSNKKQAFIQSGSGAHNGINIYRNNSSTELTFQIGDSVEMIGVVTEYEGLLELTVNNDAYMTKISGGNTLPEPVKITIDEFTKAYQGVLITIESAELTDEPANGTYSIEDASGETLNVGNNIYNSTTNVELGQTYHFTGIGYYSNSTHVLLPRSAEDIVGGSSIHNWLESKKLVLYPNPVKDMLYVQAENVESISVYSLQGQIVAQQHKQNNIRLSHLPTGTYAVRIVLTNGIIVTQTIVK